METDQLEMIHSAFEELRVLPQDQSWPSGVKEKLDQLAWSIAGDYGLNGSCDCPESGCLIDIACTSFDEAINTSPGFIEWDKAQYLYGYFPLRERDAEDYDDDTDVFQAPGESNLTFAKRCINRLRESDGEYSSTDEDSVTTLQLASLNFERCSIHYWIASNPQRAGHYYRCFPESWASKAAATAGLRKYGFRHVEELTESDLPRLGFPPKSGA